MCRGHYCWGTHFHLCPPQFYPLYVCQWLRIRSVYWTVMKMLLFSVESAYENNQMCGSDFFWTSWKFLNLSTKSPPFSIPNVHDHGNKMLTLTPVLSQINPVDALWSHLLKTHFNIILPSTCKSPKLSLFPWVCRPNSCMQLFSRLVK
jgi:hypothetical protein